MTLTFTRQRPYYDHNENGYDKGKLIAVTTPPPGIEKNTLQVRSDVFSNRPKSRLHPRSFMGNTFVQPLKKARLTQENGLDQALSPLCHAVLNAALGAAHRGTVRPELMVSSGNMLGSVDIKGDAIFTRQAELIKTAKKEIFIQTFAWDPEAEGSQKILDALLEVANRQQSQNASSERPKVRLMVNEGVGLAKKFMQSTTESKSSAKQPDRWPSSPHYLVGNYKNDPHHQYASLTTKLDFEVRVHQHHLSNSLHGKSVIVDGSSAALTGANVQRRNHGHHPAYDFGVTLSGPVAAGLRDDFVCNWNRGVNPDQSTSRLQSVNYSATALPTERDGIPMLVLTRKPDGNLLSTSTRNPQNQAILTAIKNARSSIQIMTPNLNASALRRELVRAASNGIKVQLLISKEFNDKRQNNFIAGGTNQAAIDSMQSQVGDHSMLDIRYFQNPDHQPSDPVPVGNKPGNGASHAKFMAVDDELVIVGSANMDKTSWHFSGETNTVLFSTEATQQIKSSVFDPAWEKSPRVLNVS